MNQKIITTLLEIINISCIIYHEGLKPIFLLFVDILKLVYQKIIKVIFFNIVKPFSIYVYNSIVSLIKQIENIDKDQIKTNLINYKESVKDYFKDKTSEQIFNELKINSKVIYLYISAVIKDLSSTKYGDSFYTDCFCVDNRLYLKTIHNKITKIYHYDIIDNEIRLSYNLFEDIPEQINNLNENDRVYSN